MKKEERGSPTEETKKLNKNFKDFGELKFYLIHR